MVSMRFYSFVLVLILLHACHSTAHTHQGMESTIAAKRELEVTGSILIKENLDKVLIRSDVERANFGGRKMKLERVLKHEMLKEEALKVEDSKITGMDVYDSRKYPAYPQKRLKDQNNGSTWEANPVNSRSQKTSAEELVDLPVTSVACPLCYKLPGSNRSGLGFSLSSKTHVPQRFDTSIQTLDTQKLLAASRKIANLMFKDYPGGGGPLHKPPTNNANPLSLDHKLP